MSIQPQAAQPQATVPRKPDEDEYQKWDRSLGQSRKLRDEAEKHVWRPLYEAWIGPQMLGRDDEQLVNAAEQYCDVVEPHLIGGQREVTVNPTKIAAGDDPVAAVQFAELLGQQATALGKAIGLDVDSMGRPGERRRCIANFLWSMGVMVLGFAAPKANAELGTGNAELGTGGTLPPAPGGNMPFGAGVDPMGDSLGPLVPGSLGPSGDSSAEGEPDLDFAEADHRELHDPGMPYARSVDPRRFLGDATYNDFAAGEFFAIEEFKGLAEAKALYPEYADKLQATHWSAPTWNESGEKSMGEKRGQTDGLVCLIQVYTRAGETLTIPHGSAGCPHVLARGRFELGIEGLPVKLLGGKWFEGQAYPRPPLLRGFDAGEAEDEMTGTVFSAGRKIKTAIIVNAAAHPKLAQALRTGDDQGVYETEQPISEGDVLVKEIGAVRKEHFDLRDAARDTRERNAGISDLALGKREPGDPNVPQIEQRSAQMSARMSGIKQPVNEWDAAVHQGLIAIAYEKSDLLHGMMLPLGQGPNAEFVVFDASRPVVGELVNYAFTVQTADAMTDADEANQLTLVMDRAPALQQLLLAENVGMRLKPLVETWLMKSKVPRHGEILYDMAPPEPDPMQAGTEGPRDQGTEGGEQPPMDPAAEFEELAAVLEQVPEGGPEEEEILARMAELQGMMAGAAA